jgi:riboflavin kinase/FMN adenylyltransferase
MRIYRSLGELPLGGPRRAIAIGTFDGVHLGHQAVIGRAVGIGRDRGIPSMVVTFSPNPIMVIRPDLGTTLLATADAKAALVERLGASELLSIPFTRAFSRIRADRFAEMLTSAPIGADVVVVGRDFRFGSGAEGTADMLVAFGRGRGLAVEIPDVVMSADGKPISSTRIRRLIAQGDVDEVIPLLGRPHSVEGVVEHGDGRGRSIGFPTANVRVPAELGLPRRGVYVGRVALPAGLYPAAVNVGQAPTFAEGGQRPMRLEAHLLDYSGGDLYGQPVRVELLRRLRDERRFAGPRDLVAQIEADVIQARKVAAAWAPPTPEARAAT